MMWTKLVDLEGHSFFSLWPLTVEWEDLPGDPPVHRLWWGRFRKIMEKIPGIE